MVEEWEFLDPRKVRVGLLRKMYAVKQLYRAGGIMSNKRWQDVNKMAGKKKSGPYGDKYILRDGEFVLISASGINEIERLDKKLGPDWDKKLFLLLSDPNLPRNFKYKFPSVKWFLDI